MEPFLYPLYAIVYVIVQPDLLLRILALVALELVVPIYWVSDWLVERHHTSIFDAVLKQRLGRPVSPLDAASREKLVQLAERRKLEARKKASEEGRDIAFPPTSSLHPVLQALVWVFTPPSESTPMLQKWGKKLVNAPFKLLLPGGRHLFAVRDSATLAAAALTPYFKSKGLMTGPQREAAAIVHRWKFRQFGIVVYILGFIPLLSWVFGFTNSVGAALLAADIERGATSVKLVP